MRRLLTVGIAVAGLMSPAALVRGQAAPASAAPVRNQAVPAPAALVQSRAARPAEAGAHRVAVIVYDDTGRAGGLAEALVTLTGRRGIPAVVLPAPPSATVVETTAAAEDRAARHAGADTVLTVRLTPRRTERQAEVIPGKTVAPASGVGFLNQEEGGGLPRASIGDWTRADTGNPYQDFAVTEEETDVQLRRDDVRVQGAVALRVVGEPRPYSVRDFDQGLVTYDWAGAPPPVLQAGDPLAREWQRALDDVLLEAATAVPIMLAL